MGRLNKNDYDPEQIKKIDYIYKMFNAQEIKEKDYEWTEDGHLANGLKKIKVTSKTLKNGLGF